ncbi:MAG: hypothetical protein ABWZ30_01065 [Jiangellaceae bacterium]
MPYINGGVRNPDGTPIASKAALKRAVSESPASVEFYGTSGLGEQFAGLLSQTPDGVTLVVVGPDPHTSRRWYANVMRTATGIKVS